MKYVLDIQGIQTRYVFDFPRGMGFFFKCYFGHQLKLISKIGNEDFVITYKISFFGRALRLVKGKQKDSFVHIPVLKIMRALLRSMYQTILPSSSSIGLFEFFVQLIRLSFLEPLEEQLSIRGFYLLHGGVLSKKNEDAIVLLAKSKGGKSTISRMFEDHGYQVISDNYAFFNGQDLLTIPECRRYGIAKRFCFSFYGKGVFEPSAARVLRVKKFIQLSFETSFFFVPKPLEELSISLASTYLEEGEGCFVGLNDLVKNNFLSLDKKLSNISYFHFGMMKDIDKTCKFVGKIVND